MTTYIVSPSGSHWVVKKGNGAVVSNHRKKAPAKQSARREAGSGDRVIIRDSGGRYQDGVSY